MENDKEEILLDCPFCGKKARRVSANLICCEDTVNCCANVEVSPAKSIEETIEWSRTFWNNRLKVKNIFNKEISDLDIDELKFLGDKLLDNHYSYFKCYFPLISVIQNYEVPSDSQNMSNKDLEDLLEFVSYMKDFVKHYDNLSYDIRKYEAYYYQLEDKNKALTYSQFLERINENKNNNAG